MQSGICCPLTQIFAHCVYRQHLGCFFLTCFCIHPPFFFCACVFLQILNCESEVQRVDGFTARPPGGRVFGCAIYVEWDLFLWGCNSDINLSTSSPPLSSSPSSTFRRTYKYLQEDVHLSALHVFFVFTIVFENQKRMFCMN